MYKKKVDRISSVWVHICMVRAGSGQKIKSLQSKLNPSIASELIFLHTKWKPLNHVAQTSGKWNIQVDILRYTYSLASVGKR